MESSALFGLSIFLGLVVAGVLGHRMLLRIAFPWRKQMFEMAADMLRRPDLSPRDRAFLNHCMDTAMSFRAGWLPLRAIWGFLAAKFAGRGVPEGEPEDAPGEGGDGRCPDVIRVGQRYIGSVLLANPLALLLSVPLVMVVMIVGREAPRPAIRHAATSLRHATC